MGKIKNKKAVENFVLENAAIMTVAAMSRELHISASSINRILKKHTVKKRKIYSRTIDGVHYNPNKPTATTYMLVCRYNYEGLSIPEIANILNRETNEIDKILSECVQMDIYWKFNYYGRSDEEKEKIRLLEWQKKHNIT